MPFRSFFLRSAISHRISRFTLSHLSGINSWSWGLFGIFVRCQRQTWESFAGVKLGFRFSTELQTAARKDQPKRSRMNRGGTWAPLDDELGRLEVRVGFGIGNKRLTDSQRRSWTSPPKLGPAPERRTWKSVSEVATVGSTGP